MAEYIDREAALEICDKEYKERLRMHDYCGDTVAWNIGGAIKELPCADVAPVVRCKYCKYRDGTPGQPNILCAQMHEDDFCSYGERKEEPHD
jgi:hypothetical protein